MTETRLDIAVVTADGITYEVVVPHHESDYIQRSLMVNGQPYEHQMLRSMAKGLTAESVVLDVGANIGNHTLYLAHATGCRVIAFEPNSDLVRALEASVRVGGLRDRVDVRQVAVGRRSGHGRLTDLDTENLGAQRVDLTGPDDGDFPVVALDDLDLEPGIDAIKVDVEGMELDVLIGAEALIARAHPALFVECQTADAFDDIAEWMVDHQYAYCGTFNATPTHEFRHGPIDQREVHRLLLDKVRAGYGAEQERSRLRADLNVARLRYREAMEVQQRAKQQEGRRQDDYDMQLHSLTAAFGRVRAEALQYRSDRDQLRQQVRELRQRAARKARAPRAVEPETRGTRRLAWLPEGRARSAVRKLTKGGKSRRDRARIPIPLVAIRPVKFTEQPGARTAPEVESDTGLGRKAARRSASQAGVRPLLVPQARAVGHDAAELARREALTSRSAAAFTRRVAGRDRLRVAAIVDEFTRQCLAQECDLTDLHPETWAEELESSKPDLVFVESAWRGHDRRWHNSVHRRPAALVDLLGHCRERGIPTVFWNKEDPVHFETFLDTAADFDHVFTTDIDCVARYRDILGHDRVHFLPFAAQPVLHNPVDGGARKHAIVFAGGYYTRYRERMRDLDSLIDGASSVLPVEIFDRMLGTTHETYQFPKRFDAYVVGTLEPSRIDIAYKGYQFALNLNSVKQSQSMFARRAYELLACGTVTVSNYARGMKVMLGDLIPMTDSAAVASAALSRLCDDKLGYDRLRLAGLRKVHLEHTYRERLRYLTATIIGSSYELERARLVVVAAAADRSQLDRVLDITGRQAGVDVDLVVLSDDDSVRALAESHGASVLDPDSLLDVAELLNAGQLGVAVMSPSDWFGETYLLDLVLASRYAGADVVGRAHFASYDGELRWNTEQRAYQSCSGLEPSRSLVMAAAAPGLRVRDLVTDSVNVLDGYAQFSIDRFDYCAGGGKVSEDTFSGLSSVTELDTGVSAVDMLRLVDTAASASRDRTVVCPEALLGLSDGDRVSTSRSRAGVVMNSLLEVGERVTLWHPERLDLESTWRHGDVEFSLEVDGDSIVEPIIRFVDATGKTCSRAVEAPNALVRLPRPVSAVSCHLGVRVVGPGRATIAAFNIGSARRRAIVPPARDRILLLTDAYPSYDHLYRNGFVHARVRTYLAEGVRLDVFRFSRNTSARYHEFEGVEVVSGGAEELRQRIATGDYNTILVHFLSAAMWETLHEFSGTHRIVIWVHGAEVQPWWRRTFNHANEAALEAAKAPSDARLALWRGLLDDLPSRTSFVFVSRYFADEVMTDLEREIPPDRLNIIHNPVDTDIFDYVPKPEYQRTRILSVRPYASRKYANDLSVAAVLDLSSEPWFSELEFTFVGDGALFDEVLEPIRDLANVTVQRGFLSQKEIAQLHKEFGVFLVPTRMDSQGVSKDEAMSSGLVPVTSAVTAIPEFVSDEEGYLAPLDDARGLADAIRDLYHRPETFRTKSAAAAARVRRQTAADIVTPAEIALIEGP